MPNHIHKTHITFYRVPADQIPKEHILQIHSQNSSESTVKRYLMYTTATIFP